MSKSKSSKSGLPRRLAAKSHPLYGYDFPSCTIASGEPSETTSPDLKIRKLGEYLFFSLIPTPKLTFQIGLMVVLPTAI